VTHLPPRADARQPRRSRRAATLCCPTAVVAQPSCGFAAAWHVPAGAPTAQLGQWVLGPGAEFFSAFQRELGGLPFIAEDLGLITPDVYALRDQFLVPGTRVLQFAFDGHSDNPYLPDNYIPNTVVYAGTHDNPTPREWYEEFPDAPAAHFLELPEATWGPE
jgi:4-alpha-glucanotransferase